MNIIVRYLPKYDGHLKDLKEAALNMSKLAK